MLETCTACKSEFLTEEDPYVVKPTKDGYKLYCYCMIKGFDEIKKPKKLSIKDSFVYFLADFKAKNSR